MSEATPEAQRESYSVSGTAGERVDTNTWPMWVIALQPLLAVVIALLPAPAGSGGHPPLVAGVLSVVGSCVWWLAVVLLAVADRRILLARGVVRPLHWGWALLEIVYVIGRSVVVRRRVDGSLLPLWVWIATTVVAAVVQTFL